MRNINYQAKFMKMVRKTKKVQEKTPNQRHQSILSDSQKLIPQRFARQDLLIYKISCEKNIQKVTLEQSNFRLDKNEVDQSTAMFA